MRESIGRRGMLVRDQVGAGALGGVGSGAAVKVII